MENVYLFLLGKELIPEKTDWATDDFSLAVGFGGWRLWPFVSPLLAMSRNVGVRLKFPLLCQRVSMPFVPLSLEKRLLLKETLPEGQNNSLFDAVCQYRVFSLQCLVQSHSLDLLSCWLCHCPFTAKCSVLLTLCKFEDNVQTSFNQSGFVFTPCLPSLTGQGGWGPEQPVLGVVFLPMAEGWNWIISEVPSLPTHSVILWLRNGIWNCNAVKEVLRVS